MTNDNHTLTTQQLAQMALYLLAHPGIKNAVTPPPPLTDQTTWNSVRAMVTTLDEAELTQLADIDPADQRRWKRSAEYLLNLYGTRAVRPLIDAIDALGFLPAERDYNLIMYAWELQKVTSDRNDN